MFLYMNKRIISHLQFVAKCEVLKEIKHSNIQCLKSSISGWPCFGLNMLDPQTIHRITLPWRHNDHAGVSNHQPHGCLFRRRSKKTLKLRVTGICVGNSPGPVKSPHKGPVTRKMFPFDDVIMVGIFSVASFTYWMSALRNRIFEFSVSIVQCQWPNIRLTSRSSKCVLFITMTS